MSVVLPIVAVVGLAVFAVGAAVVSTMVANHPGRAALLVVLVAAGAAAAFALLNVAGLGIGSVERALETTSVRRSATVVYDPGRLLAGLGGATGLLALAAWLVRTGDWARVDRGDEGGVDGA